MNKQVSTKRNNVTDGKDDIVFMDPINVTLFNRTTCTLLFDSEDLINDTGRFKPFPPSRIDITLEYDPGASWALMQDVEQQYGADAVIRYIIEDSNWVDSDDKENKLSSVCITMRQWSVLGNVIDLKVNNNTSDAVYSAELTKKSELEYHITVNEKDEEGDDD